MQPGHKHGGWLNLFRCSMQCIYVDDLDMVCLEMAYFTRDLGPTYYEAQQALLDLKEAEEAANQASQKLHDNPHGWLNVLKYDVWEPFPWDKSLVVKKGWWAREEQWKQARQHAEAQITATGYLMPRFVYH